MNKQMKHQSKLDKFFSSINLNCTMNDLLQQYLKTFGKNIPSHPLEKILFVSTMCLRLMCDKCPKQLNLQLHLYQSYVAPQLQVFIVAYIIKL